MNENGKEQFNFKQKLNEMQQNNSIIVANAFKKHYDAFIHDVTDLGDTEGLSFVIGDLSSFISSPDLQTRWGLLPEHTLIITMERPNKFKARLISPELKSIDHFTLKTQLEVMLEKVITPDQSQKEVIQTVWEMLIDMGFIEEVARLAVAEADNVVEKAIELAIPFEAKIRAENLLAYHAHAGRLEEGLKAYYRARLEHLTWFCLLCDNVVENHDSEKSCVCSRYLCEWQFKQIGLVPASAILKPKPVQGLPPAFDIVSLSVGEDHSVACFRDGRVFSWGKGNRGQLGDGLMRSSPSAVEVAASSFQFAVVAAGNGFSIGLSVEGHLWVWGTGRAALGLNLKSETLVPKPTRIDVLTPENFVKQRQQFIDISVADRLCFAIASDKSVYVWGEHNDRVQLRPIVIPELLARSVTAHYAHPVCIDIKNNILIWDSFKDYFLPVVVAPKGNFMADLSSINAAFIYGNVLCVYDGKSVQQFSFSRDEKPNYLIKPTAQRYGILTSHGVGTSYGVFVKRGKVKVFGIGSEVMCSEHTVCTAEGIPIPEIRYAHHIAAGPSHVVCVAMSDRVVNGQREVSLLDLVVYQWGRDHTADGHVICQGDVRRDQMVTWAKLADQAAAIANEKKSLGYKLDCEPTKVEPAISEWEEAKAYAEKFYKPEAQDEFENGSALESWNNQFLVDQHQQQVLVPHEFHEQEHVVEQQVDVDQVKIEEPEQVKQDMALDMLDKCYEMRDKLRVEVDDNKQQLVIDLNHPHLLVNKILDDQSHFKNVDIDINARDNEGNTAIMLAMQRNDYDLFTKILGLNPDVNAMNYGFKYPLDTAVSCGGSYSKAFVTALVEKGATELSPLLKHAGNKSLIADIITSAAEFYPKLNSYLDIFLEQ